jgi:hypothetical protein
MNFLRRLFGKKPEQPDSKQSARSNILPPQLEAILRELSQPARITDMPRRVQLCEPVRAARQVVRTTAPDNPIWLAYSVYAHPNARVQL